MISSCFFPLPIGERFSYVKNLEQVHVERGCPAKLAGPAKGKWPWARRHVATGKGAAGKGWP